MEEIKIFAPATIANISCGFDVLGCCLDTVGDEMIFQKVSDPGLSIKAIHGEDLPLEIENNVVGAVGFAMMEAYKKPIDFGITVEIFKNVKPGSGIGSSAASAAGTAYAINELLGKPFNKIELINFAREGERLACGSPIADNVAPALLGGFTLVKDTNPLKVIELPVLDDLYATIIHPQIEIKTSDARSILSENVALETAVKQWANVGSLVSALYTNDHQLFSESLVDYIVEPKRSMLIPEFDLVKKTALKTGALGCGISGSGPSIFSFSKGIETAEKVKDSIEKLYSKTGINFHTYVSKINLEGVKVISKK